jgi:hypothetical protein
VRFVATRRPFPPSLELEDDEEDELELDVEVVDVWEEVEVDVGLAVEPPDGLAPPLGTTVPATQVFSTWSARSLFSTSSVFSAPHSVAPVWPGRSTQKQIWAVPVSPSDCVTLISQRPFDTAPHA